MLFILSIMVLIRIKKKEKAGYTLEQERRLLKSDYKQKHREGQQAQFKTSWQNFTNHWVMSIFYIQLMFVITL